MKKPSAKKTKETTPETKGAKAKKKGVGHQEKGANSAEDANRRALFLVHKGDYVKAKDRLTKAQTAIRGLEKVIKSDGFKVAQVKDAILMDSPEGEEQIRMEIANRLIAAQWAGSVLGQQLALFLEPDRTPAVDMAADEGTRDAMENKVAKPGYDPSTPQHRTYMEAYHTEQARQIKSGIKPLNSEMN